MSGEDAQSVAKSKVRGRNGRLPIEVVERIIGFLDVVSKDFLIDHYFQCSLYAQRTIARCALVSRDWLPFSLYKLYFKIVLSTRRQWDCFFRTLRESSPRIQPYFRSVRELYIQSTYRRLGRGWKAGMVQPWEHLVLLQCAQRLPCLMQITFHKMGWGRSCCRDCLLFAAHDYTSLTRLDLYQCTFRSIYQLRELVFSFPALSDLTLVNVTFKRLIAAPIGSRQGPRLKCLVMHLKLDAMITVTQLLIDTRSVQSLTQLRWWCYGNRTNAALCDILAAVDGSLEDLECKVNPSMQRASFHQTAHLLSTTDLSVSRS